ncbi:hypothetical protein PAI11_22580 [Patulibacter medicamentivorans]|uniref:Uncharacterized protein n=1 Tax=Patulibacter medicamentivorans TaxID=1097667 RepID=H0E608_9ACTN|nr:hypothetical protein [Patulibacter medicamentivorans]EHN10902.1 hypothetical protein PAI11_22580 [Patulibacter medicamentivorans]
MTRKVLSIGVAAAAVAAAVAGVAPALGAIALNHNETVVER